MIQTAILLLSMALSLLNQANSTAQLSSEMRYQVQMTAQTAISVAMQVLNEPVTTSVKIIPTLEATSTPTSADILLQTRQGWSIFNPENTLYPSCVINVSDPTERKGTVECGG